MPKAPAPVSTSPSGSNDPLVEEEEGTVKPATRVLSANTARARPERSNQVLPDSLMLGNNQLTTDPDAPEVLRLHEALAAKDQQLSAKDAEIASLKEKLAKSEKAKKQSPTTKNAPVPSKLATADTDLQALEQQFAQQERLLSGYQKENERATLELQTLRTRCVRSVN